jgi:hypothetical protein
VKNTGAEKKVSARIKKESRIPTLLLVDVTRSHRRAAIEIYIIESKKRRLATLNEKMSPVKQEHQDGDLIKKGVSSHSMK